MSIQTEVVSDSLVVAYHKQMVGLNGALHGHSFGSGDAFELNENASLLVVDQDRKSSVLEVWEINEPPQESVLVRFIFRVSRSMDIVDASGLYVCPRSIGASALQTHIELAKIVHEFFVAD